MKLGINYQTECMYLSKSLSETKRDLEKMKKYGFEAIRLTGDKLDRLLRIAKEAKSIDLEVWLGPKFHRNNQMITFEQYLRVVDNFTAEAEKSQIDTFIVGNELSLELRDFVKLQGYRNRCENWKRFQREFQIRKAIFKDYLTSLAKAVKRYFSGPITYAAGEWELDSINWKEFDLVGANLYWWKYNDAEYFEILKRLKKLGKPVAITEFGFQTHDKAFDFGPAWWFRKSSLEYNEEIQASLLHRNLKMLKEAGIDVAFIFQWSEPDDAGFGLVRRNGTPKKALSLFEKLRH